MFNAATQTEVLADIDALRAKVAAIEPTDALEQQLAQVLEENTALGATIDNQTLRMTNASAAIVDAQQALVLAADALAGQAPAPAPVPAP